MYIICTLCFVTASKLTYWYKSHNVILSRCLVDSGILMLNVPT